MSSELCWGGEEPRGGRENARGLGEGPRLGVDGLRTEVEGPRGRDERLRGGVEKARGDGEPSYPRLYAGKEGQRARGEGGNVRDEDPHVRG